MGKNKKVVDGQYVHICKKWSELNRQQKEWIMTKTKNQYKRIADSQHRPITKIEKRRFFILYIIRFMKEQLNRLYPWQRKHLI